MIKKLKQYGRFELAVFLNSMAAFCLIFSVTRVMMTGTLTFLFLNWNLFLAFIPWLASSVIMIYPRLQKRKTVLISLLLIWLLFFPNSPYILTDLFHLRAVTSAPIWFDLLLILSFAWTGLVYGFVSLMDIEVLMRMHFKEKATSIFMAFLLFLGSFGVYLGRFLRWNSWDIVQSPGGLFSDIFSRFSDPFSHPRTWGMTVLLGTLLNFMFWSVKLMRKNKVYIY